MDHWIAALVGTKQENLAVVRDGLAQRRFWPKWQVEVVIAHDVERIGTEDSGRVNGVSAANNTRPEAESFGKTASRRGRSGAIELCAEGECGDNQMALAADRGNNLGHKAINRGVGGFRLLRLDVAKDGEPIARA